jgi:replicative DNA helicase
MTALKEVQLIREPFHSVEAEQAVIGAILHDNGAFDRVADVLMADDFFVSDHRALYRLIAGMLEASHPVDAITLVEALERSGESARANLMAYVGELQLNTPGAANARRYAELVRERSILRRLSAALSEAGEWIYAPAGRSAQEILDQVQQRILAVTEGAQASSGLKPIKPILAAAVERIDEMFNRDHPSDVTGVPTGFIDLDRLLSGMQPGDLITIGARPSMGKSALALNIAEHVAVTLALPVGIFSLEMPEEQLATRMLASSGRLNHFKMRKGALSDADWERLAGASRRLADAPLYIDETSSLTPMELRARARRLFRAHGKLGLLVVDYIQLMVGGGGDQRQQEIGQYSRLCKALAKELNCPVIALSQVNRGVENRPNKRPNMSDLRESGDIEQDSDVVMFLYRDEVYHADSKDKGTAELVIAKQRNGPIGMVRLAFLGEHMRFENYARAEW